jgi:Spy/CpxP family protein refolding chaperone
MASEARKVHLVTALLLVAIFGAGVVTGAAVCRWTAPPHGEWKPPHGPPPGGPPMPPEWRALDLTADQAAQARQIADRHRPELEAAIKDTFPKLRAIDEQMEKELRAILTPEQQKKLDEVKAHRPPGFVPGVPPPGGPPPGFPPPHGGPPPGGPPPGFPPPPPPN